MDQVRIIIADDQAEILEVASQVLAPEYSIVATFTSGQALLEQAATLQAEIMVLDISMGEMSGFDVAQVLRQSGNQSKIIFLSVHEDAGFVRAAMDCGAAAYVFKSRMSSDLKEAIRQVVAGGTFISPNSVLQ